MRELEPSGEDPNETMTKIFRSEIGALKEKEKQERETAHFEGVNPEELTFDDMIIYQNCKNGFLSLENFNNYRQSIPKEQKGRREFAAYIGNMLMAKLGNEQLRERNSKS